MTVNVIIGVNRLEKHSSIIFRIVFFIQDIGETC